MTNPARRDTPCKAATPCKGGGSDTSPNPPGGARTRSRSASRGGHPVWAVRGFWGVLAGLAAFERAAATPWTVDICSLFSVRKTGDTMNVTRDALRVYCSARWGRRRVRVTECAFVLRAEALYDQMLREGHPPAPGGRGQAFVTVAGRSLAADWTAVANRLWVYGRVFLRCPRCGDRVARLYLPTLRSPGLECRRCWGLTYHSRTHGNYHRYGGGLLAAFGCSPAEWERDGTRERRQAAKASARVRYQERRRSAVRAERRTGPQFRV